VRSGKGVAGIERRRGPTKGSYNIKVLQIPGQNLRVERKKELERLVNGNHVSRKKHNEREIYYKPSRAGGRSFSQIYSTFRNCRGRRRGSW